MFDNLKDPQKLKDMLERLSIKGLSGGGEVQIMLSGTGLIKKVSIEDMMMRSSEKIVLENMIVAAYADAHSRLQEELIRGLETMGMRLE